MTTSQKTALTEFLDSPCIVCLIGVTKDKHIHPRTAHSLERMGFIETSGGQARLLPNGAQWLKDNGHISWFRPNDGFVYIA